VKGQDGYATPVSIPISQRRDAVHVLARRRSSSIRPDTRKKSSSLPSPRIGPPQIFSTSLPYRSPHQLSSVQRPLSQTHSYALVRRRIGVSELYPGVSSITLDSRIFPPFLSSLKAWMRAARAVSTLISTGF